MNFKMNYQTNYKGTVLLKDYDYDSEKLQIPDEVLERWIARGLAAGEKIQIEVPTLQQVLDAGYSEAAAQRIIDEQKQKLEEHQSKGKKVVSRKSSRKNTKKNK